MEPQVKMAAAGGAIFLALFSLGLMLFKNSQPHSDVPATTPYVSADVPANTGAVAATATATTATTAAPSRPQGD